MLSYNTPSNRDDELMIAADVVQKSGWIDFDEGGPPIGTMHIPDIGTMAMVHFLPDRGNYNVLCSGGNVVARRRHDPMISFSCAMLSTDDRVQCMIDMANTDVEGFYFNPDPRRYPPCDVNAWHISHARLSHVTVKDFATIGLYTNPNTKDVFDIDCYTSVTKVPMEQKIVEVCGVLSDVARHPPMVY